MSVAHALRWAVTAWFICVAIASAAAGAVLAFGLPDGNTASTSAGLSGSVLTIAVVGAVIPIVFAIHWRMFRRHWRNGVVEPAGYLKASVMVHVALSACIVAICIGCLLRGSMMPELVLILALLALLMLTWPSGWAMTHPVPYDEEDDEQDLLHIPPTR